MATGNIPNTDTWKLMGTSSNASETQTYPSTAVEVRVSAKVNNSNVMSLISSDFSVADLQNVVSVLVGGYYYNNSTYGYAMITHDTANRTLAFRNLRFGGTESGTFTFYYR